jgi:hypothetical protein
VAEKVSGLGAAPKRLIGPATLGDPPRPLLRVSKSMGKLARSLTAIGHKVAADTICNE